MPHATLITGGAGFIGAHVAEALLARGDSVRVLDSLVPEVHGPAPGLSSLNRDVELVVGDVRDRAALARALRGIERVVHLAARVDVGQSMYEMAAYTAANATGTATLLEELIAQPIERLVVASSMAIYGEGLYVDRRGEPVDSADRTRSQLERGQWEPLDDTGAPLVAVPTPESKPPAFSSVYGLTKYDQERLCLLFGQVYNVATVGLRFFNVYGPSQWRSNPCTGALAVFASRLLNGQPPLLFEDGGQRRDFVHVRDVARACLLALEAEGAVGQVINVGSGHDVTMAEVAGRLARTLGKEWVTPRITTTYRVGDVRHCFADLSLARRALGYRAEVSLDEGLSELGAWLEGRRRVDPVDNATVAFAHADLVR